MGLPDNCLADMIWEDDSQGFVTCTNSLLGSIEAAMGESGSSICLAYQEYQDCLSPIIVTANWHPLLEKQYTVVSKVMTSYCETGKIKQDKLIASEKVLFQLKIIDSFLISS